MTVEEELILRYFDAFNRHDLDAVMACFHADPVVIDMAGRRFEGRADVRRHYEASFALLPDGRCDLRTMSGRDGCGMAESLFTGRSRGGRAIEALGVEVVEMADGKITAIRDYHRLVDDGAAEERD
jgi:ketosteroid isomerase-like protein